VSGFYGFGRRPQPWPAVPAADRRREPETPTGNQPRFWRGTGKHGLFYARLELPEDQPHAAKHRADGGLPPAS
jgi:hypothetical protein